MRWTAPSSRCLDCKSVVLLKSHFIVAAYSASSHGLLPSQREDPKRHRRDEADGTR